MKKNIIIRADSSSKIGTGHIMRDLVLAKQFEDANIFFAAQTLPGNINHKIIEAGYQLKILQNNDLNELVLLIQEYHIDMVIIDHYDIDYRYEKALKEQTDVEIFVLDDTYEKHDCDILLNHNIYADSARYKDLVPENCELRCGPEYTLLRDEFIKEKQADRSPGKKRRQKVFIAMGGSDIKGLTPKILKVLEAFDNIDVNVVTTTANLHLEALQNFVKNKAWIALHVNSAQIAKLMADSDLAIVTPSVTLNEVWYMHIPFIAIQSAKNQNDMVEFLINNNQDVLKDFEQTAFYEFLAKYLEPKYKLINFLELIPEEKKQILEWRNDPDIRKWMYNKELITLEDHLNYIAALKDTKERLYFLVKSKEEGIGVIDFTSIDFKKKSAEIGLYAKPGLKGVGDILMMNIIRHGFGILKLKILYSNVYIDNVNAIGLYEKYGFKEVSHTGGLINMELRNENR